MKIALSDIQKIPNVELINRELFTRLKGVSIDSRTVKANDLFFAIKGENHDGHNFIDDVIKSQAKGIVIAKSRVKEFKDRKIFIVAVNDTTLALGKFSNVVRKKFQGKVIGITGSNGKTTTKEMIYEVLASKYRVLKSEGNLNNHIGVPLTLLKLNNHYDYAIVEMGINHFGEMEYLIEIVEPDYGCITNIGNAHLEFFKSIEGVARAKGELFKYLAAYDRKAIVNVDDKYVREVALKLKRKITYGFKDDPDVKGEVLCLNNKAQPVIKFGYRNHSATVLLNTFGLASAANALCASAFGFEFEVGIKNISLALESYSPVNKRMEYVKIGQVSFINDSYNANPNSMILAFDTLSTMRGFNKKIAVIGDMLELGKDSVRFHKQIANLAKKAKVDALLTYGELTLSTFKCAKQLNLNAFHFKDKTSLINELEKLLIPKTLVLVKGSRKMKMEEVIGGLK